MFKGLNAGELYKPGREYRVKLINKKIQEGLPFLLINGKEVTIKNDSNVLIAFNEAFKSRNSRALNTITFSDKSGKTYTLKDFAKSAEFGGRGAGSGTRVEDAALKDLQSKLSALLQKEGTPYIKLKIGQKTCNVVDVVTTPGTPKSDFHFIDNKGNECFWVSHKAGSSARDFQQYGGMVELDHMLDVRDFTDAVKRELNGQTSLPPRTAYARKVKDRNVILKSLYGKDYKSGGSTSRQNIDALFQGEMDFVKSGSVYTIRSKHSIMRGEIPTGDYEPWYLVRQSTDRSQFGIKSARFFIVPRHYALSRKANVI